MGPWLQPSECRWDLGCSQACGDETDVRSVCGWALDHSEARKGRHRQRRLCWQGCLAPPPPPHTQPSRQRRLWTIGSADCGSSAAPTVDLCAANAHRGSVSPTRQRRGLAGASRAPPSWACPAWLLVSRETASASPAGACRPSRADGLPATSIPQFPGRKALLLAGSAATAVSRRARLTRRAPGPVRPCQAGEPGNARWASGRKRLGKPGRRAPGRVQAFRPGKAAPPPRRPPT